MAIVSQTEFAKMTGRSRQAISQRTKRGSLIKLSNGKLDTENEVNAAFLQEIEEDKVIHNNPAQIKNTSSEDNSNNSDEQKDITPNRITDAKSGQEVLKFKKLQIEVRTLEGELVRKDSVADACFSYLSALNINIMEAPQSFLDELEGVIINKGSRSAKMNIVTKPICDAIDQAIKQVERILKSSKDE